ncbi:Outer membrane protein beta-barrel domain-containing protein [Parapedobacter composti]|uniref:Outer membrane protein beta-barrel domain-containing protein n=1 Tax=Parapedobacter composti TaxID=623281 RepID=A0A1I1LS98_9SPHI|nr:outer membrane beta-barrel protein [Parapedobacter composti]SFC75382.1 Outer membrane protein beta-barrel domain-containing protein [Parapedobacter composti]
MKTLIKISITTFLFAAIALVPVQAQTADKPRVKLSVGPETSVPMGDLSDRYDWSLGGSIQAEFPLYRNQLALTLSGGFYNLFAPNHGYTLGGSRYREDLQVLPVKLGLKYFPVGGLFIQGEAGTSFLLNKSDGGYDKEATFTYSPQVGYRFNLGGNNVLDAGIKWEGNTKFSENGTANHFLGLRIAYAFSL